MQVQYLYLCKNQTYTEFNVTLSCIWHITERVIVCLHCGITHFADLHMFLGFFGTWWAVHIEALGTWYVHVHVHIYIIGCTSWLPWSPDVNIYTDCLWWKLYLTHPGKPLTTKWGKCCTKMCTQLWIRLYQYRSYTTTLTLLVMHRRLTAGGILSWYF